MEEKNKLHKLKSFVFKGSIIMLLSNAVCFVLGYLREALIVRDFGASNLTDAWYIAYNIPDLLLKFLLFGALGAVFMPVFIEYLTKGKEEEAWMIASSVINFSVLLLIAVSILGMFFAPNLIYIFAPGFDKPTHILAVQLTRCVLPLLAVIGASGLLGSIYTSYFHYFIPSLAPVINSGVLIFFITAFSKKIGIFSVAAGTVSGYILSFLVLALFIVIYKRPYKFRINLRHPAIREIIIGMIPLIGAEIIGKCIGVVNRTFASLLGAGSITSLNLANRIVEIPVIFFSTTFAVAIFPALSRCIAADDKEKFSQVLVYSLKMCLLVIFPCFIGILVMGRPLIKLLFEHGKFTSQNTEITWQTLLFLSISLFAFSIRPVLARACYALKKNWLLFKYELLGFVLNALLAYTLMSYLGIRGIALSTTIVVSLMTGYLLLMLYKQAGQIEIKGMARFIYKVFVSGIIMGLYTYFVFYALQGYGITNNKILLLKVFFTGCSSGIIYFCALNIFKTEEVDALWKTIRNLAIKKSQIT